MDINAKKLGMLPSVMDGSEHIAEFPEFELPAEFSYRKMMIPAKNQGTSSMCVGYSLCYVLNLLNGIKHGVSCKDYRYKPETIYAQRVDKYADGMMPKTALAFLKHSGLDGLKISNYAKLGSVYQAKQSLMMVSPFILGLPVYDNELDEFWTKRGQFMGYHCVTCTGYHDTGMDDGYFEILNSWGTSWADKGYCKLKYKDWMNVKEAWCITL